MKNGADARGAVLRNPDLQKLWSLLPRARLVGGCVRDMLLGLPCHDIDLATPDPPGDVIEVLGKAGVKVAETGLSHGTVTAILGGRPFEVTSLRQDIKTDGRHAIVAWTDDWREDAARRDFTINAMSCDQSGTIYDYFDGREDLAAHRVRFVGNAEARIREDALRLLRYIRFEARYGSGTPEPSALTAVHRHAALVTTLSTERVNAELSRILLMRPVLAALHLMQTVDMLTYIVPNPDLHGFEQLLAIEAPHDVCLRLAALSPAENMARHLKRASKDAAYIAFLNDASCHLSPCMSDDDIRRCVSASPKDHLIARSWLLQARGLSQYKLQDWQRLRTRLAATPTPIFPLKGRDLLAQGLPPGPELGDVLAATTAWWRDGGCRADHDACLEFASLKLGLPRRDASA